jgi:hypothetical protein
MLILDFVRNQENFIFPKQFLHIVHQWAAFFVLCFCRNLGELGCTQSLLPLVASGHLTSRLNANVRAFSELSHGTFCRTCPDR